MQSNYSDFSCETLYTVGGKIETKISKERLHLIPELKVAPQNLTITLSDVVEEGKRLNFSCESVEGKPSSNFTYSKLFRETFSRWQLTNNAHWSLTPLKAHLSASSQLVNKGWCWFSSIDKELGQIDNTVSYCNFCPLPASSGHLTMDSNCNWVHFCFDH